MAAQTRDSRGTDPASTDGRAPSRAPGPAPPQPHGVRFARLHLDLPEVGDQDRPHALPRSVRAPLLLRPVLGRVLQAAGGRRRRWPRGHPSSRAGGPPAPWGGRGATRPRADLSVVPPNSAPLRTSRMIFRCGSMQYMSPTSCRLSWSVIINRFPSSDSSFSLAPASPCKNYRGGSCGSVASLTCISVRKSPARTAHVPPSPPQYGRDVGPPPLPGGPSGRAPGTSPTRPPPLPCSSRPQVSPWTTAPRLLAEALGRQGGARR